MRENPCNEMIRRLPGIENCPKETGNYTYIMQCADGTLYTGWTTDLSRRIHAHNSTKAGAKYTHAKRPVELVYYEELETKQQAMKREFRIKQMSRKEKLELILARKKEVAIMKRNTFALQIREGKKDAFRQALGQVWEEAAALMDRLCIRNFSLWTAADLVFGYYETGDGNEIPAEEKAAAEKLLAGFEEIVTWLSRPGQEMRLMYHNFGIVRENKELIRHRMFMTKLKPGCAEEYKHRHDGLIEQRGDTVDPGPDSNFSIWSDGTYIFGYNEIDTTMEKEETEEEHAATVAWETRQLEIMDWITNDCDWLTGEVHDQVRRIAWHN